MPQEYYIMPVGKHDEDPVDPDFGVGGGSPSHPITLPPLPGILPKPGEPSHPITLPPQKPGHPSHPIFIPESPEHPIALPPGTIWPPLPPDSGITGKVAILIWVIGVGHRWFVWQGPAPPAPTPTK